MNKIKAGTLPDFLSLVVIVCYFIAGLLIVPDYGINWDDTDQRENGLSNWNFITHKDKSSLIASEDKYHGPAFELLLVAVEKQFQLKDLHDIFVARHYCVFLFFCTVLIAFFLLCRKLFESSWAGLAGLLMLLLSPRIFAESFYNPKDIVFMGGMIWSIYTLLIFVHRSGYFIAICHAFSCAFATDLRVIGILLVPVSLLLFVYFIYLKKLSPRQVLPGICCFLICYFIFLIAMWPILSLDPIHHLFMALKQMSNYVIWDGNNIYCGHHYPSIHTPWHYHWVWLLITSPEIYSLLFLLGLFAFLRQTLGRKSADTIRSSFIGISLFFFFLPLLARSVTQSVVYDAWRHVFFTYPFAIIIAVYGLVELSKCSKRFSYYAVTGLLVISMCDVCSSLITMHPFQFVYFNRSSNAIFRPIDKKFEMDYWGVSYKQGLEYLMLHEKGKIKVCFGNKPGMLNYLCLKPEQRERFETVKQHDNTVYFMTNYRDHWIPADSVDPLHSIRAQNNVLLGIYKLK